MGNFDEFQIFGALSRAQKKGMKNIKLGLSFLYVRIGKFPQFIKKKIFGLNKSTGIVFSPVLLT